MPNGAMSVPSCPCLSVCASSESPSRADTPFIACRKASRSSPLDAARAISASSSTEQQVLGCYCSRPRGCPSCRRRVGCCRSPVFRTGTAALRPHIAKNRNHTGSGQRILTNVNQQARESLSISSLARSTSARGAPAETTPATPSSRPSTAKRPSSTFTSSRVVSPSGCRLVA